MPITTAQVEVSTTRVLLHQTDADGCHITVHADVGPGTHIHLGNGTVTTANGFELDGHQSLQFFMPPASSLYAIQESGTNTVSVMVAN